MAVPDSSPQASAGVPVRIPQILMLADGTFSPLVANVVPWGRVSGPAGLAPEALLEREGSYKGFSLVLPACGVFVSTGIGDVPAGFGHTRMTGTA
jgi:hypothetical protein